MACKAEIEENRQIEQKLGLKLAIVYDALYFESSVVANAFDVMSQLVSLILNGSLSS